MKYRLTLSIVFILTVLSLLISACAPAPSGAPQPAAPAPTDEPVTRLRIRNAGSNDITGLVVLFPNSRVAFGDVPAGSTSEYQSAPEGVYNYGAYEYANGSEKTTQPVIDWVGESPRPGKRFTYVIDYDPARGAMMRVKLVEVIVEE